MTDRKSGFIDQKLQDLNRDGIDRRGFLECMAWVGTGLIWTVSGGIPVSRAFAKTHEQTVNKGRSLRSRRSATATWDSTSRRIRM